ncbi:hypothetical protein, partial [Klebsiella pneumoniae]|uniref:hypothetical protein n=1 Tax=Klebsiella pneumoniae TaxID=573 RepID=UPI00195536AA
SAKVRFIQQSHSYSVKQHKNHIMTKFTRKVKTGGFLEFTFHYIGWVGGGLMYVIVIKRFLWSIRKVKNSE